MDARALVIDDEPDMCGLLARALADQAIPTLTARSASEALELLKGTSFDVVLTDVQMPGMNGLQLCERVAHMQPGVPVIVVTGHGDVQTAIDAMRAGAYDFLIKPVDHELLSLAVTRALTHRQLRAEVGRLRDIVEEATGQSALVGSGPGMRRVHETIARLVESDASVVVCGETGTGKELVARRVHDTSRRSSGPFVSINCAAVPRTLLESELFGHVKGAFTDARETRKGLFLEADRGTLFLDEIAEMPIDMQSKLLRALQEKTVRAVGSNEESPFDARIIAATNRDLDEEIFEKRFREDLFYRINVVRIDLPPLRDRRGDILQLAQHFLAQHAKRSGKPTLAISVPAAEKLVAYRWPGNVRELQNGIEHAIAFSRFDEITVDDLPERVRDYQPGHTVSLDGDGSNDILTLAELERRYVERALSLLGGNKTRAADALGIDRRTLYRRLDRWSTPPE
jgi:two-component system, NtrC family, response regulator HydG